MPSKHIAMISVHECPLASSEGKERGGINVYVFELAKALTRLGWYVDMYTRVQDMVNPRVVVVNDHARVIHLPNGEALPLSKKEILLHLSEFTRNMEDFIRKDNASYDLVHAHYYLSGIAAVGLQQALPNLPFVMTFHTLGLMKQLVSPSATSEDPPERIHLEQELAKRADRVIAVSNNTAAYLTSLYDVPKQKIAVISPGVDPAIFFPADTRQSKRAIGADPTKQMILAVGRIDPVKGFDVLLYALKILFTKQQDLLKNVCVAIVGGDVEEKQKAWSAERTRLEKLRKTLGLETSVRFIRAQPQEKLPRFYNAADVLVMPSHYESFGMVALEALACGTPVIATDVTGISAILKDAPKGHIVSANNPIGLAEELVHVLTHPHKRTVDPSAIAPFTWTETAKKAATVYERVAKL